MACCEDSMDLPQPHSPLTVSPPRMVDNWGTRSRWALGHSAEPCPGLLPSPSRPMRAQAPWLPGRLTSPTRVDDALLAGHPCVRHPCARHGGCPGHTQMYECGGGSPVEILQPGTHFCPLVPELCLLCRTSWPSRSGLAGMPRGRVSSPVLQPLETNQETQFSGGGSDLSRRTYHGN